MLQGNLHVCYIMASLFLQSVIQSHTTQQTSLNHNYSSATRLKSYQKETRMRKKQEREKEEDKKKVKACISHSHEPTVCC